MPLTDALEAKIRQGVTGIFTAKAYPKFLAYASRFLSFSWQNIVLLYMQAPDACCAAGLHAWDRIAGKTIPPDRIPILILYPEIDKKSKAFSYTIRKVFGCGQAGNTESSEEALQVRKCSSEDLFACFKDYYRNRTGKSVYLSRMEHQTCIEEAGLAVTVPPSLPDREKFRILLEHYASSLRHPGDPPVLSGCVANSLRYVVLSRYEIDGRSRITFPYIALPSVTEPMKLEILKKTVSEARQVTAYMDSAHFERLQAKQGKTRD